MPRYLFALNLTETADAVLKNELEELEIDRDAFMGRAFSVFLYLLFRTRETGIKMCLVDENDAITTEFSDLRNWEAPPDFEVRILQPN